MDIKNKTRLLFVEHEINDFVLSRIHLAAQLDKLGFDVHLAVPDGSNLNLISGQKVTVHQYHLDRLSSQPFSELRCFASLFRLYRNLRPQLVHHFGLKPSLYGGIAARVTGVPAMVNTLNGLGFLVSENSFKRNILKSLIKAGLKFSSSHHNQRVVLQNSDDYRRLLSEGVITLQNSILIKGSGVDILRFIRKPEPAGVPVVLMVSRMIWEKGVREFAAAARNLKRRGMHARFVLVGDAERAHPSAIPLSALNNWCATGNVEWLKWQGDMPTLMAGSNLVCLPSYYGEGIPRVLMEAAASGRAIITTDAAGCREVVRHNYNGLLIPARSHLDLEEAIIKMIENDSLRAEMGIRGREIAEREYAMEKIIRETIDVYRTLLMH